MVEHKAILYKCMKIELTFWVLSDYSGISTVNRNGNQKINQQTNKKLMLTKQYITEWYLIKKSSEEKSLKLPIIEWKNKS